MISFSEFTNVGNRLLLMALIAIVVFGVFELVKRIFKDKIPTWVKKGFSYFLIPIAGIIYGIIAFAIKDVSPIATGFINGVLFTIMESSAYILIDTIIDFVNFIVGKLDSKNN